MQVSFNAQLRTGDYLVVAFYLIILQESFSVSSQTQHAGVLQRPAVQGQASGQGRDAGAGQGADQRGRRL